MTALFVNHTASLGGAELMLLDVLRHGTLDRRLLLFEGGPLADRLPGVSVEILGGAGAVLDVRRETGLLAGLRASAGVARLARGVAERARGADVLVANSQKAFVVAAVAGRLARRPVVWYLHDLLTPEHFGRSRLRVAVGLANRLAARVVCNSEATRAAFVAAGGDPGRASVVYNGISPGPFDAVTDEDSAAARHSLGLSDEPIVGVFGRIDTWKGQEVLLDALCQLPRVQGLVVGEALWGKGALTDALHERARALGITDRVTFAGFRDDIPALMRACAVVAHTSTVAEPFGRVIVEGMLAGRPVVATDAGGAREIVRDGETGRLVPPGDAAALAAAVGALLADPERARTLADAGRADVRRRFSVAAMVAGIEAEIRSVVL